MNTNTIYFIGGSPRSGKTTIFNKVINKKPMVAVSSDAVREGLRNVFTDESYISMKTLSFQGSTTFHRPGENDTISHDKHFAQDITEDELTWKGLVGLINHYDRKNIPLIIEGVAITPQRIKELELKNLKIQAVFVGFTNNDYLETMLENARKKNDWIYKAIQENNGDDTKIRDWFSQQLKENIQTGKLAEELGYKFFTVDNTSFEKYCEKVTNFLLQD